MFFFFTVEKNCFDKTSKFKIEITNLGKFSDCHSPQTFMCSKPQENELLIFYVLIIRSCSSIQICGWNQFVGVTFYEFSNTLSE